MTIHTSNLPALIEGLADAPQPIQWTEFDRPRQVAFLEALATGGSVRSAARAADVSSQTVYRLRRADAGFRLAWQGALLAARARAEDTLACRAIDGIEQEVLYHGEVVATRRRYSDRLLLAHLARLDRLTGIPRINAFAEDFESALARFAAGEPQPEPGARRASDAGAWTEAGAGDGAGAGAGDGNFSSGECHNRSMSYTGHDHPDAVGEDDCAHWAALDEDDGDHRDTEEVDAAIRALMERKRPEGAATPSELAGRYTAEEIAAVQQAAFEDFHQEWWLVIPPAPPGGSWAWCHLEPAARETPPEPEPEPGPGGNPWPRRGLIAGDGRAGEPRMAATSDKNFKAGDKVEWKSSGGTAHGKVVKTLTAPMEIKGHHVAASEDNPEYLVETDEGAQAAHKPGALTKR